MRAGNRSSHPAQPSLLPLVVALAAGLPASAWAQQQQPSEAAPAAAEPTQLEQVLVTAQRRVQKVSDVPISMTSLSGAALADRGATSLHDVAEQMAGAQIFRTAAGQPTWIIRGVGLIDFSPNNTPTAAVYQDDVYQVSTALSQLSLFDVGRVEVLKGPQGGIYGRNTSGGAVRVISNLAEFGAGSGEVGASLGSAGVLRAKGYVGGTVVDNLLAVRVAADLTMGGNDRVNLITSGRGWGKKDQSMLRASALLKLSDRARITAILDAGTDQSQVLPHTAVGYASLTGSAPGYWCAPVLAGYQDDKRCMTYGAFINTVARGRPGTNDASVQDPGRSSIADPFGAFDVSSRGLTVNADVDLSGMKLISITHKRTFDFGRSADSDAVTGEFGHMRGMTRFDIASQEFRLQSAAKQGLRWTLGTSVMRDNLDEDRHFDFRDNVIYAARFGAYGVAAASQLVARLAYQQETKSASAYGQVDLPLSSTVNLGVALRYTDEQKTYRNGGFGFPLATGAIAPAVASVAGYQLAADYELNAPWSGKASIDWKPMPSLMTYASVSKGFKVGGFFGGFPLNGVAAILPYKEETVLAYELGFKTDASNRTAGLSGALYRYNYNDAQNFTTVFSTLLNRTIVRMDNIGRARHDGVELEGWWRPIKALRLQSSVSFLNARYLDSKTYVTLDGLLANYKDQKRPYSPKRSWTLGADYNWSLESGGTVRLGADANGRSDLMQSFGSQVDRAIGNLPGYTLGNLRAHYVAPGGQLEFGVVVRNVADKKYAVTYGNDGLGSYNRYYGEPRSILISGSYAF